VWDTGAARSQIVASIQPPCTLTATLTGLDVAGPTQDGVGDGLADGQHHLASPGMAAGSCCKLVGRRAQPERSSAMRQGAFHHPSPRLADELAKLLALPGTGTERVDLVRRAAPGAMDRHPSRPGSGGVDPGHRRPRTARDRGDNWGAGTTWSTGSAAPEGVTGALAPVPIVNRRSPSSASRDG
jgi:hypothetical protein